MIFNLLEDIRSQYDLHKIFKKFNKLYFNNELPTPIIKWIKSKKVGGSVTYKFDKRNSEIIPNTMIFKINYMYNRSEESLYSLILHEMIHVWQAHMGYIRDNHGKYFLQKKKEIESKITYKIPLTDDVSSLELSDAITVKAVDVILRKYDTGEFGMAIFKDGFTSRYSNKLNLRPNSNIYNVKLPELIDYPVRRALTRLGYPKTYNIIDEDLYKKIIKNGVKLR